MATQQNTGATDDPGAGGNSGMGDAHQATDAAPTAADGGQMNYGGTDAAYDGMEDRNEGDAGDRANAVDRDDMDQPTGRTGALSGGGMTGGTEPGDGMNEAGSGPTEAGGSRPSTSGSTGTLSGGHSGGA